jgi:hypothetical protein
MITAVKADGNELQAGIGGWVHDAAS